ncbi:galactosylgalactosylxylosylprotein 3-beta-glucuronosyltransferase I [Athalia rosae]|uniref:galactosylgalactosylxylosylprotein 3-beta-glucuronosyltransferase I n=1 Tax=Athalia rosae TaxID=37344 RepID=UPI002033D2FA|nr:galactosylgalactosylxylosylprotein 3-beta-glucuronosyltransferase I [Athalia rosae]
MVETAFLTNENWTEPKMRNRRFLEYTLVLILTTIIILQWISYETLQEKYSSYPDIKRRIENSMNGTILTPGQTKHVKIMIEDLTVELSSDLLKRQAYWRKKPTIYAITPTFARPVQKAELTRLAQTFMHVPTFHWILVEDSVNETVLVSNLLKESGIAYTHLTAVTPPNYKLGRNDPNWKKPRGIEQRNAALKWLRENLGPDDEGIVYFADDDNTYSIKLFEEMEKIRHVGVWPVGLVGGLMVERPLCDKATNKVIGFNSVWKPDRPFPMDMAGFAVNVKLLLKNKDAWFSFEVPTGYQESEILRQITTREQLEPLADFCTKVYVWHTRTEPPKLSSEQLLIKKGKRSNAGMEV